MVREGPGGSLAGPDGLERLARWVGTTTFQRGRAYARSGAVRAIEWTGDTTVSGLVVGTRAEPYRATVTVRHDGSGRLAGFDGSCTCPVGFDCKHAVALLIAAGSRTSGDGSVREVGGRPLSLYRPPASAPPVPAPPAAWEHTLAALLEGGADRSSGPTYADRLPGGLGIDVALQFDYHPERPQTRPQARGGQAGPGLRLRPVSKSPSGNWVRSEVSWSRLDSVGYYRQITPQLAAQLALLAELRSLAQLAAGSRYTYGYNDEQVWLESIPSRRVWDLLAHLRASGVPLISAGKAAAPVTLHADGTEVRLDITTSGRSLELRAQLLDGGPQRVAAAGLLPVGSPAHGLAWFEPGDAAAPRLHLAPLRQPLAPAITALLSGPPLTVPARDLPRFTRQVLPRLQRAITCTSSDGSVDLDDVIPDEVVLRVFPAAGTAIGLEWALTTGDSPGRSIHDGPDERADALLEKAAQLVEAWPTMVLPTPWGVQLAERAVLPGLDAARFLARGVPELEALDGITVVGAADLLDYREAIGAPDIALRGDGEGGDWLDLEVEIRVEGEVVPFHQLFLALAEGQRHMMLPSGVYFSLECEEFRRLAELIAEARELREAPPGRLRLNRYQASMWEDLEGLGTVDAGASAWLDAVRALQRGVSTEHPVPAGLKATLRPYQYQGFCWLATLYDHGLGGVLADDMGLGKTLQALALIAHARQQDPDRPPFLVVAPTSVVGNWVSEAATFTPGLDAVALSATATRRGTDLAEAVSGADLVVTSYALFRIEFDGYAGLDWDGLLLDEAQFAKNPASRNNQNARALPAPFKLALTGTPMENSLRELWATTSIVAPGLFPSLERFTKAYQVPIERHGDEERLDRLRRRLRPLMLRRTKAQVAPELPDKQEQVLEVDLHPRHRKRYDTYLARERQKVLGLLGDLDGNRFEIFRSLTLLRQASLDIALVDLESTGKRAIPSAKLDALAEMVEEAAAEDHRVLVFSQFTRFLEQARHRLEDEGVECAYLDGKTKDRDKVIAGWRAGSAPVFLVSLKAGGFGLNLTEADHCVLLDPWWNPATEAQAVDRVHRFGQTRKVMVYRLVAKGTIEEKVMALKARKAALFASVVDEGGFESAALSAADIAELLG